MIFRWDGAFQAHLWIWCWTNGRENKRNPVKALTSHTPNVLRQGSVPRRGVLGQRRRGSACSLWLPLPKNFAPPSRRLSAAVWSLLYVNLAHVGPFLALPSCC
ncbi:hypothetical protein Y032_0036g3300 [Ancylostoma ceylanicum]|uniref:Uncharacterized protein n=1 Tax=Ancylostoma ceylanicum TaxID=53326 RepID=A0A016UKG7_9BILA|nr:hypothetical protein Y032_0036g3300 [Ancylostoma ceylanicum]